MKPPIKYIPSDLVKFTDFSNTKSFVYTAQLENMKQVYDGDTITRLSIDLGFSVWVRETIRLVGIDTPELRGTTYNAGIEARDWLREQLEPHDTFTVRTHKGTGKYGRWLAEVSIEGRNLNREMVKIGLAKAYWI